MREKDNAFGYTLAGFGDASGNLRAIRKTDVRPGDCVLVRTRNSLYILQATADGRFSAWGGWFKRKERNGSQISVNGCSLGGSIININVIAALGMCIEFSNRLITTPVECFVVLREGWQN